MLTGPITREMIPAAITIRQNGKPSDFCEVAALFMLPKMLMPRNVMAAPSITNPWLGEKSGQLREK